MITFSYHPATDSLVLRFNQTLMRMLRMFVADTEKKMGVFVTNGNGVSSLMAGRKVKWVFHSKQPQATLGWPLGLAIAHCSHFCTVQCCRARSSWSCKITSHMRTTISHGNCWLCNRLNGRQQKKKGWGPNFWNWREGPDETKTVRTPKGEDKGRWTDVVITSWTSVILRLPPWISSSILFPYWEDSCDKLFAFEKQQNNWINN